LVLSRTLTKNQLYAKMSSHPLFIGRRRNLQNSFRSGPETVLTRMSVDRVDRPKRVVDRALCHYRTYWKCARSTDPTGFLFLVQHRSTGWLTEVLSIELKKPYLMFLPSLYSLHSLGKVATLFLSEILIPSN